MKYLDEYRQDKYVKLLAEQINKICTKPWQIMEVCGGQTHTIVKYSLQDLLSDDIQLIHGPGCPVCVTPIEIIDQAIAISMQANTIVCTFGDMLRVPGTTGTNSNLLAAKANGADVRIVYSPLDSIKIAEQNPQQQVIFFGVGFETTAPANAIVVDIADRKKINNFSILVSNVRVPPVLKVLLADSNCQVQGFLAAGNVCTIMGETEYFDIVDSYQVPIVITGFEPIDILQGIKACIMQLESKQAIVENQYKRIVRAQGNQHAQHTVNKIFKIADRNWRGLGDIPDGGFVLREQYMDYDASLKFNYLIKSNPVCESICRAGDVLQGKLKPNKCPSFGNKCTPDKPLGAPMVSMEGACHAYYQYSE